MTLKLKGSSGGSVSIDAPANTNPSGSDVTLTLPVDDGDANQVLQTDGSGALSFGTQANKPCWYGKGDAVVSMANNTWTVLKNFATDPVNIGSGWDESEGRFTCNSGDEGIYYLFGGASVQNLDNAEWIQTRWMKNGANVGAYNVTHGGITNTICTSVNQIVVSLTTNDYMEFESKHLEGSTEDSAHNYCWFGGYKLVGVSS